MPARKDALQDQNEANVALRAPHSSDGWISLSLP